MEASSYRVPEGKGSHKNMVIGVANDADVSPASIAVHLKNTVDALKAESKVPIINNTFLLSFPCCIRPVALASRNAWRRGGS
jgi:hypothetical protein